jgi:hypothetical protein
MDRSGTDPLRCGDVPCDKMHAESKINKPHANVNLIYFIDGSYGVKPKGFFIISRKVSRESKEKLPTFWHP